MSKSGFARGLASALALTLVRGLAFAQQPAGADEKLVAAAKAEGEVVVYSTAPPEDNKALASAFEARYGVPVKIWRASSEDILQRAMAEANAGRPQADAFINTGLGLEPMSREKLLRAIDSPLTARLIPEASPAHREWTGFYLAIMVQLYNTNLVKKADLPKSWDDLLDSRWAGKLAIEAADSDWFQAVVENIGKDKGLALFRDIAAKNRVSVRKGHSLLANLVVAGEIPLALTTYDFTAAQLRRSGAPVDFFAIAPAMAVQVASAVAREPKHPAAAMLFHDFLLGEAQDILARREFITTRRDVVAKAPFPIQIQDAPRVLDGMREWEELYRKTFVAR